MRRYLNILLHTLLIASPITHAGPISSLTESLLSQTPAAAFSEAAANNDVRMITIPFCGGITPGFNFREYSGPRPIMNDFGITCHTLLGSEEMKALNKLEAWATKYNELVYEHLNVK